jgi:cyclase
LGFIKLDDTVYADIVSPDGNAVGNAGVVILDQSVLVFDTHFTPEAGAALLASIRSVTSKPVRYVVNSHWHADHTHGNQVFADAQLIGSANTRRDVLQIDVPSFERTMSITQNQLEKLSQDIQKEADAARTRRLREQIKVREDYVQTMSRLKIMAPFVILDDYLTIQDKTDEARILFLGPGHTDGDIVLFLPTHRTVFVGDLFFNKAIPNVQDGSVLQWMKTLEEVLKLDADTFVPGHGPVGTKKDVEAFLHYFQGLKASVEQAIDLGDSMDQAVHEIEVPAKYSTYQFQNFFPSNVQKMYSEIQALRQEDEPEEESPKSETKESLKAKQ